MTQVKHSSIGAIMVLIIW